MSDIPVGGKGRRESSLFLLGPPGPIVFHVRRQVTQVKERLRGPLLRASHSAIFTLVRSRMDMACVCCPDSDGSVANS